MVGVMLIIEGIIDLKTHTINVPLVIISGLIGSIIVLITGDISLIQMFLGLLEGVFIAGLSFITKEGIGYGDSIVIGTMGILLGWKINLIVLLGGIFICAITSIILLIIKRADRKKRIPFIPFLAASFLLEIIGGNIGKI